MSMQTYYDERVKALKAKVLGETIAKELEMKMISNKIIEEITSKMKQITKSEVFNDFRFKTGKIFGILRHIAQNPKNRKELLEITGLNEAYIDMFTAYCGNMPYLAKDGSVNIGRTMDAPKAKDLIQLVGAELGILVEDSDVDDITQERWNTMYENTLKKVLETSEFNKEVGKDVEYEE